MPRPTSTAAPMPTAGRLTAPAPSRPNFHVFGGYTAPGDDDFDTPFGRADARDFDQWRLGLGYNHEIELDASTC